MFSVSMWFIVCPCISRCTCQRD